MTWQSLVIKAKDCFGQDPRNDVCKCHCEERSNLFDAYSMALGLLRADALAMTTLLACSLLISFVSSCVPDLIRMGKCLFLCIICVKWQTMRFSPSSFFAFSAFSAVGGTVTIIFKDKSHEISKQQQQTSDPHRCRHYRSQGFTGRGHPRTKKESRGYF